VKSTGLTTYEYLYQLLG